MGGYRPRRVSISQYEQLTAAAAEGLKRESSKSAGMPLKVSTPRAKTPLAGSSRIEHSMISPSNIGISPPLRSPPRGHDATHHAAPRVGSPPSVIQVKRARTVAVAPGAKEGVIAAAVPSSSAGLPTTIYIAAPHPHEKVIVTPPQKIVSPKVSTSIFWLRIDPQWRLIVSSLKGIVHKKSEEIRL
ncbi:unnamed protein product [Cylicostephanus goldi]|uniref:Uncharacterized protein n=1 Tax=Cylicostephanus goldi TaxID=71465 RepID=A0A3P7MZD9_CYLGO|nr:unnamed protein product [Cylicostephanus goldi]